MRSKIIALSKNEDFKNLLKKKKVSNKYVTIFFGSLVNKNDRKLNISFVTKKKQIKSAVKRNKVKRRLRNIINDLVKKNYLIYIILIFSYPFIFFILNIISIFIKSYNSCSKIKKFICWDIFIILLFKYF